MSLISKFTNDSIYYKIYVFNIMRASCFWVLHYKVFQYHVLGLFPMFLLIINDWKNGLIFLKFEFPLEHNMTVALERRSSRNK